jgi:hypothetical protein
VLLVMCCYEICVLHAGFLIGFFSTLNMEATCYSEASVDFQRIAGRYIPFMMKYVKSENCWGSRIAVQ